MKLIKPYYEIITPINGEEILKQIELAARTCYKSEDKIEYCDSMGSEYKNNQKDYYAISARKLITKLISLKHEAMFEFGGNITVKFICDRGVSHELVRHRLCSFAQESTRYCNYSKNNDIVFILPIWIDKAMMSITNYEELNSVLTPLTEEEKGYLDLLLHSEQCYNNLIKLGETPQQARSVLPNSLKTEINLSANIREWRHIFKLRTAKAAHPQMRELMIPLCKEFQSRIPILFDDIKFDEV